MFRFLIAEDDLPTLRALQALLAEAFDGAVIHIAATVIEALELIRAAAASRRPYHVAILDFKLPKEQGANAEVDESLCFAVREQTPGTLVAHITAYREDPEVDRHVRLYHSKPEDPDTIAFSKRDVRWAGTLVQNLKAYLYGSLITPQLDALFGTVEEPGSSSMHLARRRGPADERCLTQPLARLCHEISEHWNDLDEGLKQRIQRLLRVDTSSRRVRVTPL